MKNLQSLILKRLFPLLIILIGFAMQGCSTDDEYRDITLINLTSVTWVSGAEFPDRVSTEYWDFYPDGTGYYELVTEYWDGGIDTSSYNFVWEFTDYDFNTIAINVSGFGWEYWTIDYLNPDNLGVYISDSDPSYYPNVNTYYQEFYAS